MNESTKAVFLSYASQDADAASRICQTLREAGIEVWLDQSELRGGDAWDAAIRKQIKACALFCRSSRRIRALVPKGISVLNGSLQVDRSHLMAAERAFLLPLRHRRYQRRRCSRSGQIPGGAVDIPTGGRHSGQFRRASISPAVAG
jgi:hypothetical protein